MGKIFNIPFSANFIEQLIKKFLELSSNFENPDNNLIILPHRRIQNAFLQELSTTNNKLLFPRATTFSSIDDNLLEFDRYCKNISNAKISLVKKQIIKQDQLYILILSIINSIKKSNPHEFDKEFLDSISYPKILKTLDEYYYYQYNKNNFATSTKIEKLILKIIEHLEIFLNQHNLILKSQSLNFATKEIIKTWNYEGNNPIFMILPQTEVSYIKYFIDNLTKYHNAYIFIRGYEEANNTQYLYQKHILDFLKRNNILTTSIKNLTKKTHIDHIIPSILLNNNEEFYMNNLDILKGKTQNEEAKLISLVIREKLKSSSGTIIVQTKSKRLANLIEGLLKFWNINVENLVNKPSNSSTTNFFLLISLYLNTEKNNYSLLLDILKSVHCKVVENNLVRNFEVHYLRKYLYREKIRDYFYNINSSEKINYDILLEIEKRFFEAKNYIKTPNLTIFEYFLIHLDLFNFLTKQSYNSDFVNLLNILEKKLTIFKNERYINFDEYILIIKNLISSNLTIDNAGVLKSVIILQTFENRNIQYKTLIFAGLNEKIFLNLSLDNNYFNNNFRILNNLKPPDSELQFLQYDFISSFYNKEVIFSYSEITTSANDHACRWLEKLLLTNNIAEESMRYTNKYLNILKNINKPLNKNNVDLSTSYPKIEIHQRPSKISVTGIEKLISNPYVYYVKYILKLKSLEKIAKHAEKKEFGIILHKLIPDVLSIKIKNKQEFTDVFINKFKNQTKKEHIPYKINKFWMLRLENLSKSISKNFALHNNDIISFSEIFGQINITLKSKCIKLTCIADKIDVIPIENKAKIIDFKSGLIPSLSDVSKGKYPQLPIEEYILFNNGFNDINNDISNIELEYFDISGKNNRINKHTVKSDLNETKIGIKELLEEFLCKKSEFFIVKNVSFNKEFFHIMRYTY